MKQVGKYEIVGRLGQGGMSTIYKAKAPVTGRIVALKLLKPRDEIFVELVGEKRLKEIFLEEARIMGGISHEHVAKILDCSEFQGMPFIVLEYFAHILGAVIGEEYIVEKASRKISSSKTFYYISQVLLGLERLHFAGIVHRDVKPYNLMITDDDRIKIIDFGLSRVRGEEKMAIPGMQIGSPHYAAPEQRKSPKNADERADLFSVGVLAHRMLTGMLPRWQDNKLILPGDIAPGIPEQWDEFIRKSLTKNVEDRFQTAAEMQIELMNIEHKTEDLPAEEKQENRAEEKLNDHLRLRTAPIRIMYRDIREKLGLDQFMRPTIMQLNTFREEDGLIAYHFQTALYWQRRGAGFPLTWEQAWKYVDKLNHQKWQGRNNWRLPTTEELCSVLESAGQNGKHFTNTLFFPKVHWLWSCDSCTKKQAWMADIAENFIERLAKDGTASVCAVSSHSK